MSLQNPALTPDIQNDISFVLCFEIGQEQWGRRPGKIQVIQSFFALLASESS